MEKRKFKKLNSGHIVMVHKTNDKTEKVIIHGYNLVSPNLRMKNYNLHQFSTTEPSKEEILAAVKSEGYYGQGICIHHTSVITRERYRALMSAVSLNETEAIVPVIAES